ncbi:MAG: hypothetical protein AAF804_03930 [Bacteroidota bacterium]
MSSYSYYDFYAIDQPLTPAQRKEIDGYSSRSTPSSRRASFEYHYGSFKYEPKQVLLDHFDMALYASSYGQYQLMIKLPADMVDFRALRAYEITGKGDYWCVVSIKRHEPWVLVDLNFSTEYHEWMEAEGWLDDLIPLRAQLLKGDYRLLYLAWLHLADSELPAEAEWEEPPVPAGLGSLDPALLAFQEFWSIDDSLIAAAAEQSAAPTENPDLTLQLAQLSEAEKDHFLALCLAEESKAGLQLRRRLQDLSPQTKVYTTSRRNLSALRTLRDRYQANAN